MLGWSTAKTVHMKFELCDKTVDPLIIPDFLLPNLSFVNDPFTTMVICFDPIISFVEPAIGQ